MHTVVEIPAPLSWHSLAEVSDTAVRNKSSSTSATLFHADIK